VDKERFLEVVQGASGIDRDVAERAVRAVLTTLGERIERGEARDLAARLPPELAPWIAAGPRGEGFRADEFLRRVAERMAADEGTAEHVTRAVFTALLQAVGPAEWDDLEAQLPSDLAPLLPRRQGRLVVDADPFTERVMERTGLDRGQAWRAIDAVLETLGERISMGEVEDLLTRLPPQVHQPLIRGGRRFDGEAKAMSLEQFLTRIAEREGVSGAEAARHARAVLMTLRAAVADDEFFDVTSQLGDDYSPLVRAEERRR
jgi:uncharacterized protein (DUF2267 family)